MSRQSVRRLAMLVLVTTLGAATVFGQSQHLIYLPLLVTTGAAQNPLHTGQATYYETANGDGNCMFGPSPDDLMVAAISALDYGLADYCGAYVEVYGPNATIQVRIVDKCPDAGCTKGHLDLSPQAFAKIAPLTTGIVPITWRVISPNLGRPLSYFINKDANQWWTAIQVRHHRNPIVKLEYLSSAGQWVTLERQDWNYFVGLNMGGGPYTLRVTDTYGHVLQDSNITLSPSTEQNGAAQFPVGP